jgi:hypothetical protein
LSTAGAVVVVSSAAVVEAGSGLVSVASDIVVYSGMN